MILGWFSTKIVKTILTRLKTRSPGIGSISTGERYKGHRDPLVYSYGQLHIIYSIYNMQREFEYEFQSITLTENKKFSPYFNVKIFELYLPKIEA